MSEFKDKRVLISGGSRGLGQALARDLLDRGCRVGTFSRSETDFIKEYRQKEPERFFWKQADGTDMEAVGAFADAALEHFGGVDVLINNAGIGADGLLTLMSFSRIQAALALNLEAAIYLTRACLQSMLREQAGCVINITSVNGIRGHTGVSVYSATKAGLDGMARSLAREVGPGGIRVNSVAPGYFESDMTEEFTDAARARITRRTPLGRLGTTDDLIGVIRFLMSEDARFITGQTIVVDGGISA